MKSKKIIIFIVILLKSSSYCFSNEIDTLFRQAPFLILFDRLDSSTYFVDKSNSFQHKIEEKLYYFPYGETIFHFTTSLINQIGHNFYFCFSQLYSIQNTDYYIYFFYCYNQKSKRFDYLDLSDHVEPHFDFILGVTSSYKPSKIKIRTSENVGHWFQ